MGDTVNAPVRQRKIAKYRTAVRVEARRRMKPVAVMGIRPAIHTPRLCVRPESVVTVTQTIVAQTYGGTERSWLWMPL